MITERFLLERERSFAALELAEAEFRFTVDCIARDRDLAEFRLEERERELERERGELWRDGVLLIRGEVLEAVAVSENRRLFAQVVLGIACRELSIEEPAQLVFFRNAGAINGCCQWWLSSIGIRADLEAGEFARILAHECFHLWARNRESEAVEEAGARAWDREFAVRHALELESAARFLQQE